MCKHISRISKSDAERLCHNPATKYINGLWLELRIMGEVMKWAAPTQEQVSYIQVGLNAFHILIN